MVFQDGNVHVLVQPYEMHTITRMKHINGGSKVEYFLTPSPSFTSYVQMIKVIVISVNIALSQQSLRADLFMVLFSLLDANNF